MSSMGLSRVGGRGYRYDSEVQDTDDSEGGGGGGGGDSDKESKPKAVQKKPRVSDRRPFVGQGSYTS